MKENISIQKNGWGMLGLTIFLLLVAIGTLVYGVYMAKEQYDGAAWVIIGAVFLLIFDIFLMVGFFTVEPNEGVVLLLFGKYIGTERTVGFRWANPLFQRKKISLRVRNFDGEKLKVNDKKGNPIEISAVIVWKVEDTAEAVFEVDNFLDYVQVQSESAVRHLAVRYAYDSYDSEDEVSLRSALDEVSEDLGKEIQERVAAAGVKIIEARINHLAYAPEIAHAMLQRQQAEAIIAARQKIVEGAVSMVEMALEKLKRQGVVELDEERKASMVSNLMVVLCSDRAVQPIVNAGSLY